MGIHAGARVKLPKKPTLPLRHKKALLPITRAYIYFREEKAVVEP